MNNINEDLIKYNTYIKVDDEFVACLREENFDKKSDRWLDFYPTDQFIELLEKVNNIITGAIREKTIRIIGSFGTGKTFAALTLKKILESSEDGIVEYFKRYQDNEKLCKLKEKYIQQSSKKIVTINVTASMGITSIEEMIDFIEDEIIKILKKKNMSISYDQTIVHLLKNKLSVPAKVHINDEIIKNQQFDGKSIDEILSEMDDENVDPDMRNKLRGDLIDFCEDKGLFIKKSQIIRNFKKWIGDIIKKNDISAFFFIWDEFQDLLEKINNLSDFQEHILGAADEKFFFVPITHVGDMNIDSGSIKKIRDRYESINIDLPDSIAFQLIGHAINPDKLDDNKSEEWKELRNHLSEPLEKAQTTIANKVKVDKDVMNKLIPMHPYAAYLLKYIAKEFQSNQRSLFQFFSEVK
ncbi:MAG: hypothetical protein LBF68_04885, partial [Christensenellaceae bacterium]|nr:hypothetical protein [Christensenellaceae bacterium]